jgi:hypothetical protein
LIEWIDDHPSGNFLMLIICTTAALSAPSDWNFPLTWGLRVQLDVAKGQEEADQQFRQALGNLQSQEPLCIVAYGGDLAIRSEQDIGRGCTWSARDIANMLLGAGGHFGDWSVPNDKGHSVTLLFQLLSKSPCNFLTNVMVEILRAKTSNFGISSYGYTSEVNTSSQLPGPTQLKTAILPQGMTNLVVGRI